MGARHIVAVVVIGTKAFTTGRAKRYEVVGDNGKSALLLCADVRPNALEGFTAHAARFHQLPNIFQISAIM